MFNVFTTIKVNDLSAINFKSFANVLKLNAGLTFFNCKRMWFNFYKYEGAGNDFILIDNRSNKFMAGVELVKKLCDRRFGIGADGLMTLETDKQHDFGMRYYNSDGKESSMCGNGGRCMVAFAGRLGLSGKESHFSAIDGLHEAFLDSPAYVRLKMQDVTGIEKYGNDFITNTGSPHFVRFMKDIQSLDVVKEGRNIRYSSDFAQDGINVNFVQPEGPGIISMRTYERGVEDETLACGTGSVASAIITAYSLQPDSNSFLIHAPGGELSVRFVKTGPARFSDVWLEGPATFVFEGKIEL